tara:strand:- start:373 stop:828 length:456 start_codon:yes stop_codon:yes gene_type:complete
MNFKLYLNNLPEDLRRKVYSNLIDKMEILTHRNKFKLTLNLINKKRHIIYKNLNYYHSMINSHKQILYNVGEEYDHNELRISYIYICYSNVYLEIRNYTNYLHIINKNGFYKKHNPSICDETYYKLKHRHRKSKNHYNRNRNKYSIKDMRR